jgi:excisionase family DNA binding protein
MAARAVSAVRPDPEDMRTADLALARFKRYLARHQGEHDVRLVVADTPEQEEFVVPRGAVELLARILAHMAAGKGVSVIPADAELTTQQAADLLNVSRPFLIKLLDDGKIEYRKVGKHRRVRAESLLAYKRADDQRRREVADELAALDQEMGFI